VIARRVGVQGALVEAFVYLALAFLLFHGAWSSPGTRLIGGGGDAVQFTWFLSWTPFALAHGHNPLLTTYLNFPDGVNLMWNSSVPLVAVAMWPVTALAGPVVSYNLFVTVSPALSAWAACIAIRRFVPRREAALIGGLLYGFSPYVVGHAQGHPNLSLAVVPPLLLLVGDEIVHRQRWRPWIAGIALGSLVLLQLFVSEEMLATEVLVSALAVVALLVMQRRLVTRQRLTYAGTALGAALVLIAVVAAGPLLIQFHGPQRVTGVIHAPNVYVSDVLNLVIPVGGVQQLTPPWAASISDRFSGNGAEQTAYLGIPLLLIIAVVGVRLWRSAVVRLCLILGVAVGLLSLGPQLHVGGRTVRAAHLPADVFTHLPVLDNLLPVRLTVYLFLLAGLVVAIFVGWLHQGGRGRALWGGGLLALALACLLPTTGFPSGDIAAPAYFTTSPAAPDIDSGAVAVVVPFTNGPDNDVTMFWQAQSGFRFRLPEGYFLRTAGGGVARTGPSPTAMSATLDGIARTGRLPALTPDLRAALMADLRRWSVTAIVVGPSPHQDATVRLIRELLQADARVDRGVEVWRIGHG
jgi:hypothetical protein